MAPRPASMAHAPASMPTSLPSNRLSSHYGSPSSMPLVSSSQTPSQLYTSPARVGTITSGSTSGRTDTASQSYQQTSTTSYIPRIGRVASGLIPVQPGDERLPYTLYPEPTSHAAETSSLYSDHRHSYGADLPIPVENPVLNNQSAWPAHLLAPDEEKSCMIMTNDEPLRLMTTNVLAWIERAIETLPSTQRASSKYHLM
jgi:hypothetical protein